MARFEWQATGFDELKDRLDPKKFPKRLRKHVKVATKAVGLAAEDAIKEGIHRGQYGTETAEPNAPITIERKKSSRPLVDTGELTKSINDRVASWKTVFVGVLKDRIVKNKNGRGRHLLSIAKVLHDGAVVTIGGTTVTIPKRPFLKSSVTKKLKEHYQLLWEKAFNKALRGED